MRRSLLPTHLPWVPFPHAKLHHRQLTTWQSRASDHSCMDPKKASSGGEEPLPRAVKTVSGKGAHSPYDGLGSGIVNGHLIELEVDLSRVIGEDEVEGDWDADTSPFPAVRAVVPETDDPAMPINTLRAWFLGIVSIF